MCSDFQKHNLVVASMPLCDPAECFSHPKLHWLWHYQKRKKEKEEKNSNSRFMKIPTLRDGDCSNRHEPWLKWDALTNVGASFYTYCSFVWSIWQPASSVCQSAISTNTAWLTSPSNLWELQIIQDNSVIVPECNGFCSLQNALVQ